MMSALWYVIFFAVLAWSAINPKDLLTWVLEVAPAVIALAVMIPTRKRFPLTPLLYQLILLHCIILMVGGHYTYAEVPLFDWLAEQFGWQRNHYDKLGHFAQGFVPVLVVREILLRRNVINGQRWLAFISVSITLAISALYELIEWWVALLSDEAADAFLGTQGYVWDTQSDMGMALLAAIIGVFMLRSLQDRQINRLQEQTGSAI